MDAIEGWDTTFHLPSEPGHKKRHYWFYGEFSCGKTTVVEKMNFQEEERQVLQTKKALWRDKDTTEHLTDTRANDTLPL